MGIMRVMVRALLALGVVAAVAGCSGEAATPPVPAATVAATPTMSAAVAGAVDAVRSAQDRFVAQVQATPGVVSSGSTADLISVGWSACGLIGGPGMTRAAVESSAKVSQWGPVMASAVAGAAQANLCPGRTFAPEAPPEPEGPLTTFSDGSYEVGVDIAAGKYKATGGENCYWKRYKDTADGEDIINNYLADGPATVTVRAGESFSTQRCGTWSKVG